MRILILEDDPLIALDLEILVEDLGHQPVGPFRTLESAARSLEAVEFALLDIDLPDGKSFPLATLLLERRVPIAFVSGSAPDDVPLPLRRVPFVPKPFGHAALRGLLRPSSSRAA